MVTAMILGFKGIYNENGIYNGLYFIFKVMKSLCLLVPFSSHSSTYQIFEYSSYKYLWRYL